MLTSMTGFGQAERTNHGYRLQVELKSVNHRYCEIVLRLPREYQRMEDQLRKTVLKSVKRGRIDGTFIVENAAGSQLTVKLNWPLVEATLHAAEQIRERMGLPQEDRLLLKDLMLLPDLFQLGGGDFGETYELVAEQLQICLNEALLQLVAMREQEGIHLYFDITKRIEKIRLYHQSMLELAPQVTEDYRNKLRARMKDLLENVPLDETRLAIEVAIYADRSDINEELTRLNSHFQQFAILLEKDEPMGRKLDFLLQEMNREVNTVGSKANHAELVNLVIEMKAELEKIREQVQNIE